MILARVLDKETNCKLIHHVMEVNPRIRMVTPYMYHHYIDALIRCDEKELALEEMKRYWGEMIRDAPTPSGNCTIHTTGKNPLMLQHG